MEKRVSIKRILIVFFLTLTVASLALLLFLYNFNKKITGLQGMISMTSGDCMPTTDGRSTCGTSYVSKTIIIREPVSQKNMYLGELKDKESTIIKKVKSNKNGSYKVELDPGKYSVFVEDQGVEKCEIYSDSDFSCLVIINEGKLTTFDIKIDNATY